jgi:hypothetical protein
MEVEVEEILPTDTIQVRAHIGMPSHERLVVVRVVSHTPGRIPTTVAHVRRNDGVEREQDFAHYPAEVRA